jgi:hypothetical protein
MKKIILITLLAFTAMALSAQDYASPVPERLMNNVTVTFLGDGSNLSLNYERWLRLSDFMFVTGRIGAGYGKKITLENIVDSIMPKPPAYFTLPVNVTFNIGKGRHFAEAGIGSTITIGDVNPHLLYYFTGGYRLQPLKKGNMSLRIFGNYLFNSRKDFHNLFFVPFGINFGIAF